MGRLTMMSHIILMIDRQNISSSLKSCVIRRYHLNLKMKVAQIRMVSEMCGHIREIRLGVKISRTSWK
ncbi:hypothetical protein H5410_062715 [Solanum commersonii]|uniref:Uncharacterized protein n=1 Tax=Solanum commersonii TaxID=4109 RepID=A0A9J5WBQ0_SOLCO|nr:hypothetical protein H5410_062715 [Solanum commersonii]